MKVVILAGGLGTRLSEETELRPKPSVEIGGRPILWHIMKHYAHYGFKEFYVALGYKGDVIKRYFLEYCALNSSVTIDLSNGEVQNQGEHGEDWVVHLVDTGVGTNTGGRVRRLREFLAGDAFMVTYGDGVSNVDLRGLRDFHLRSGSIATVTAVRPPARFGAIRIEGDLATDFTEKPQAGEGFINGGFLVLDPRAFEYLKSDDSNLELDVLTVLSRERKLSAYRHSGFWQCMDTLRDKRLLESLWESGRAPWKVWA